MKLILVIKNWYRGKPAPPTEIMIGKETFEMPWDGRYIQPAIVRLFKNIISTIRLIFAYLVGFWHRHWEWIVGTLITLILFAIMYPKK